MGNYAPQLNPKLGPKAIRQLLQKFKKKSFLTKNIAYFQKGQHSSDGDEASSCTEEESVSFIFLLFKFFLLIVKIELLMFCLINCAWHPGLILSILFLFCFVSLPVLLSPSLLLSLRPIFTWK